MNTTATLSIVACFVVALVAVPAWQGFRRRLRIKQRMAGLDVFVESAERDEPVAATPVADDLEGQPALVVFLDRRYPLAGGVRTGISAAVSAGVAGLVGVLALSFFGVPVVIAVAAGLLLGVLGWWAVGALLEGGLRVRFADRLLAAVDEFQRMVRFGMPPAEAFRAVAATADEPVKESLARVRHSADLGVPLAVALDREAQRVQVSELAMLAAIFATQAGVGGGLAESVGNLADMLRERKDNRARMKAATAESKLSLAVLSAVPLLAIGIQGAFRPEIFAVLLGDARHLLGIGLGLVLLGLGSAWLLVRRTQQ